MQESMLSLNLPWRNEVPLALQLSHLHIRRVSVHEMGQSHRRSKPPAKRKDNVDKHGDDLKKGLTKQGTLSNILSFVGCMICTINCGFPPL